PAAWLYVPDKARQAADTQIHRNYAGRLTWQATPRNKFNFSYEKDRRITPLRRIASTVSPEATTYTPFYPNAISTIVWRVPYNSNDVNGNMNYNFLNGVPRRITLYATPIAQRNDVKADTGIFAQDSWAMNRMTINYGIRYDYLHVRVPAQHLDAGQFVPERNFAPVENAPKWNDINPRVGVSYDLFGTGRTVAKFTVGRYISGGSLATNVNPVNASVNNATR